MSDIEKKKRVAAKMREWANMPESDMDCDILNFGEVVLDALRCGDTQYDCFTALAELVEPDCDREALLALAEEMGSVRSRCDFCTKKGDCDWADETICLESRIDDYARRIREACGVSE